MVLLWNWLPFKTIQDTIWTYSFQVASWQGGPSWTDGNKVSEHLNVEKYIYCIKKTWRVQALRDAIRAMSLLHSMQCHDDGVMQAVLPFVGHLCCEGKCFLQLVLLGELFGGLPQWVLHQHLPEATDGRWYWLATVWRTVFASSRGSRDSRYVPELGTHIGWAQEMARILLRVHREPLFASFAWALPQFGVVFPKIRALRCFNAFPLPGIKGVVCCLVWFSILAGQ